MTGKGGTPANSEDPDEMLYNVAFHRSGSALLVKKNKIFSGRNLSKLRNFNL